MICLTFDVEERFHSHLTGEDSPRQWRSGDQIARLVDFLEEQGKSATFFLVGELAEHYPALIRRIADAGFEIASHSYSHLKMDAANQHACEADITRSKHVLEDITGRQVVGYRSPTWTAKRTDDWLWDHLIGLGFRYDSSLFPIKTHLYGSFSNPVRPCRLRPELWEIPPSAATFGPVRIPYGGGFYLRFYPMWLTRWLLARDLQQSKTPNVYVHPWELVPARGPVRRPQTSAQREDVIESSLLNRFIGNFSATRTWPRLMELVRRYETGTMKNYCEELAARK